MSISGTLSVSLARETTPVIYAEDLRALGTASGRVLNRSLTGLTAPRGPRDFIKRSISRKNNGDAGVFVVDHRFGKRPGFFFYPPRVAAGSSFSNLRDCAHSIRAKNSRTIDSTTHT